MPDQGLAQHPRLQGLDPVFERPVEPGKLVCCGLFGTRRGAQHARCEQCRVEHGRITHHQHALDLVAQLAHIARPVVVTQALHRLPAETVAGLAECARRLVEQALTDHRDVTAPRTQRRQMQAHACEAIVEILAKTSGADLLFEVTVGRGDHTDIHGAALGAADRTHLTFLQHTQQFHLEGR